MTAVTDTETMQSLPSLLERIAFRLRGRGATTGHATLVAQFQDGNLRRWKLESMGGAIDLVDADGGEGDSA